MLPLLWPPSLPLSLSFSFSFLPSSLPSVLGVQSSILADRDRQAKLKGFGNQLWLGFGSLVNSSREIPRP